MHCCQNCSRKFKKLQGDWRAHRKIKNNSNPDLQTFIQNKSTILIQDFPPHSANCCLCLKFKSATDRLKTDIHDQPSPNINSPQPTGANLPISDRPVVSDNTTPDGHASGIIFPQHGAFHGPTLPGPDLPGPEHLGPDLPGPDHLGPDITGPDLPGPDHLGPDLPGPDLSDPDHLDPDLSGPDHLGPDITGPDLPGPDLLAADLSSPNSNISSPGFAIPGIIPVKKVQNKTLLQPQKKTRHQTPSTLSEELSPGTCNSASKDCRAPVTLPILKKAIRHHLYNLDTPSDEDFDVLVTQRTTLNTPSRNDGNYQVSISTSPSQYQTPLRKTAKEGGLPSFSPSDIPTNDPSRKRQHISQEASFRRSRKYRQSIKVQTEFPDGLVNDSKLYCGNESIPTEFLESKEIGMIFKCVVCNGIPSLQEPILSNCCSSFYCPECWNSWKEISQTCFLSCFEECNKLALKEMIHPMKEFQSKVWGKLQCKCPVCEKSINIKEFLKHKQFCKKSPVKVVQAKDLKIGQRGSSSAYRSLRTKLGPIIKAVKSLKDTLSSGNVHSQSEIELCLETIITFSSKDTKMKNLHQNILAVIKNLSMDDPDTIFKLSPLEAAALRKKCDLSVRQVDSIRRFLGDLEDKVKKNPLDPRQGLKLNPFVPYHSYHKCDVEAMPSNCSFTLHTKEDFTLIEDHKPTKGGGVYSITEDYEKYGSSLTDDPKPAILGSYLNIKELLANELTHMSEMIKGNLPEELKTSESAIPLTVDLCMGADGISGISEIKTTERYHLPAKVFVSSIRILQISTDEMDPKILYKNPKPNKGNQLPLANVLADESDNFAVRSIYLKSEKDIADLRETYMKIGNFVFSFKVNFDVIFNIFTSH